MSLIFKSTENIYLCYMKTRTAILELQSRQADAFQLLAEERRGREILLGMGWSFLTPGWPDGRPASQELSAPCSHCSTHQPLPKSGCPLGNHSGNPPIPIYCPRSTVQGVGCWGGISRDSVLCFAISRHLDQGTHLLREPVSHLSLARLPFFAMEALGV